MIKRKKRLPNAVFLRSESIIHSKIRKRISADNIKHLIESIARYGIINPITVREAGNAYELVSGEKRLMAARILDLDYIPCIIISANSKRAAEISFAENFAKCDVDYFEKSDAITELMKTYGLSDDEILRKFGIPRSDTAMMLRFARFTAAERYIINEAKLPEEILKELIKIYEPSKRIFILQNAVRYGLSAEQVKKLVSREFSEQSQYTCAEPFIKGTLKDAGIIENSLERIVSEIKAAGISAESKSENIDGSLIFTIKIDKECKTA